MTNLPEPQFPQFLYYVSNNSSSLCRSLAGIGHTHICVLVFSEQSALVLQRRAEFLDGVARERWVLGGKLAFRDGGRLLRWLGQVLWTKAQRV